jgi:AraC-like DNA-binding protein
VIDGELMEALFKAYRMERVYAISGCPQLKKYFDEMRLLTPGMGALHQQAAVIFHRLLEECYSILYGAAEQSVQPAILELKKFLDDHLEDKVNLAGFCRARKHSCAHMIRCFKKQYGTSPYDYLMQKRMDAARLMLRHSAFSVKEIASRLKFSDQYYFSNYFKRKTGMSPRKYKSGNANPR